MKYPNLVLIRHGQSLWNRSNVFTGWTDIGLSSQGEREARAAGRLLKKRGFVFDRAYASVLQRSIKTLWLALEEMEQMYVPTEYSWRLNERHYGALQGKNKLALARKYGAEKVFEWRRSFATRPPLAKIPAAEIKRLAAAWGLKPSEFPKAESLKETARRVMPVWNKQILPALKKGENVLVVAHGNSLRGLIKHLEGISDADIPKIEIPTGRPLCYEITKNGTVRDSEYLK